MFQMTAFSCCRGEPVYREDSTDHQVVDLPRVGAGLNPAGEEFRTPDREFLEPVAIPLSSWGERLMERQVSIYGQTGEDAISFRSSGMRIEHFPYGEWRSALNYAGGKGGGMLEGYCPPQGRRACGGQ